MHSRQGALFVADDAGWIRELSLSSTQSSQIRESWQISNNTGLTIQGLSIDWLFNRLYLLVRVVGRTGTTWKIGRCRFDGHRLDYVVTDIIHKPFHVEVDPFNGYVRRIVSLVHLLNAPSFFFFFHPSY